jgi:hypothetical protein
MKKLLPILIITLSSLLITKEAWSLPNCSGNYWNNCFGEWTYEDGSVYVGEYKNDLRVGQGKMTTLSGELVFEGKFVDDFPQKGVITSLNNETNLIVECSNSMCSGKGTLVEIDGSIYVGEIQNSLYHGQGKLTYLNGVILEGIWENGVLIKSTQTSTSSANNTTYTTTSTSSANNTTSSNTNKEIELVCEDYRKTHYGCPSSHQERWASQHIYVLDTSKLQMAKTLMTRKRCWAKPIRDEQIVWITSNATHIRIKDSFDFFNIDRKTLKANYQNWIDLGGDAERHYLCKVFEIDTSSNKI